MCDLYPLFRSCCGVSVRIALLYIAILAIVTGALINAALKKAGVNVASIQDIRNLKKGGLRTFLADNNDTDEEMAWTGEHDAVVGPLRDDPTTTTESVDSRHLNTKYDLDIKIAPASRNFVQKVSSVNKNGMNLLSAGFLCLGVLLLIANFMKSPEVALVSVAVCVALAIAALVLLVGVVGECAKARDTCLLSKLDWFTNFIVTLFWFMYIFCWLFFAGVANAFANGAY